MEGMGRSFLILGSKKSIDSNKVPVNLEGNVLRNISSQESRSF
jgi:hypothetical protein